MKKKLLSLIIAVASILSTQTACANNCYSDNCFGVSWIDNWYIQGSGSVAWHNTQKFNQGFNPNTNQNVFLHFDFETGFGAAGSLGMTLCRQWRLEAEVVWRRFK